MENKRLTLTSPKAKTLEQCFFYFSLNLTLGWKNEKQPSSPTELDLEAGNLVSIDAESILFKNY